jgi:hypothetical protein
MLAKLVVQFKGIMSTEGRVQGKSAWASPQKHARATTFKIKVEAGSSQLWSFHPPNGALSFQGPNRKGKQSGVEKKSKY